MIQNQAQNQNFGQNLLTAKEFLNRQLMIDNIEIFNNLKLKDQSMEGYNLKIAKTIFFT